MNETTARAMTKDHFDASDIGSAGGGPGDDIARERWSLRRHTHLRDLAVGSAGRDAD
jgi:hypothetical protein